MGRMIKDETGNRYGRLIVLKHIEINKHGEATWLCECDCGERPIVSGAKLRRGRTKSCGCLRRIDESGNKHRLLTVIKYAGSDNLGHATWLCECECGNKTVARGKDLRQGNKKSCGCLCKLPPGVAAMHSVMHSYKQGARKRGLVWNLTDDQFKTLTQTPCYYCGTEPENKRSYKYDEDGYTYSGIDRKNNSKGYTMKNCVPCCHTCNWAKRDMSIREFAKWARRLCLHFVIWEIL